MKTSRAKRQKAYSRGYFAEYRAAWLLLLQGYRIVARRYRTRLGEIDLIARRGDLVLIVEVKARASMEMAMDAVTPSAMGRIEAAADIWLSHQPDYAQLSLRFDLIAVRPWRWPQHQRAFFVSSH